MQISLSENFMRKGLVQIFQKIFNSIFHLISENIPRNTSSDLLQSKQKNRVSENLH